MRDQSLEKARATHFSVVGCDCNIKVRTFNFRLMNFGPLVSSFDQNQTEFTTSKTFFEIYRSVFLHMFKFAYYIFN